MPYRHTVVFSGERLRSKAIGAYAVSFCVSGSASGAGVWCDARERGLCYAGTSGVSRKNLR